MQQAYLKGKSTETALHDLVYKIDGSLAEKEFALGVFLDVEGAFDNTSFDSMDDAASDHSVCSTINRWIDFMLRSRCVFCRYQGSYSSYECAMWLSTGGCIIALILWNMVTDSLSQLSDDC
jgi:hypothetical protein